MNRALGRRGRFWADRWHGHALVTPREVRNALVYVLQNHRKHAQSPMKRTQLDEMSSAQWFDGFVERAPPTFRSIGPPPVAAETWLLRIGWRKRGRIRLWESPKV